jgi:hypothetical protein
MGSSLVEDDLQILRVTLLELLLQEAAAVLVLAQRVDLVGGHRLEIIVDEAIGICNVSMRVTSPKRDIPLCMRRLWMTRA